MGLDMFLRGDIYVSRYDYKNVQKDENQVFAENKLFSEIVEQFNLENVIEPDGFIGFSIDVPVGYWRKANQIHKWFVDEIAGGEDDCQKMFVPRDRLEELKDICQQVLDDNSLAEELLPVGEGFFFGSYEYDEYYFQDLKDTIEILNRCLASDFEYFEYQASW